MAARCDDLVKTYRTASGEVRALQGLSAEVPASALLAVVGPSGSGKSSLLRLIAGLDRPTSGTLVVEGTSVHDASARTLRRFRRATVGYLFQRPSDNFLPHLTVGEHLRLARGLTHRPPRIDQEALLSTLGIRERVDHLPSELSGGEQQRAAIAEVLMGGATIVVADEPTAELDSTSASHVMDTMVELARAGVTFVVATHDRSVMRRADAALELDHGLRRSSTGTPADPADRSSAAAFRAATAAQPDRAHRWRPPVTTAATEPELPFALDAIGLSKAYRRGDEVVHALDDVSLTLRAGELVGLVGRSGSGKTTLLNVIAGWEHADAGTIERPEGPAGVGSGIPGWDELAVVPQKLGLFDELSVRENLEYPARLHGRLEELRARVDELMQDLGIAHLAARYPKETSLGEQQRTAVARALVLSPTLVLADEPTGHQDAASERRVLEAFGRAAAEGGTCLIATHNVSLAPRLDRVLEMADGRLEEGAAPRS
ncbi:MAG TPA: ATP-binding cassette domain-containing protein [Actinomycetota bacterium]|nr:ATP-binding cassette domain-containing protein [Actinomycetota bacterium]